MSERPVIAVAFIRPDYRSALEQAGAEVRELSPETDLLPAALDGADGVLLTGGMDVAPSFYGETEQHPTVEVAHDRDDYELALARLALDRDMPLLAICRGAQVLNVAAGGTLVQDIPSEQATTINHTLTDPKDAIAHDVTVAPESTLASLLASRLDANGRVAVNSRHHQSVKRLAPGFQVSATAPDGIIEAIEKPGAPMCIGVQWHPENFWRTGEFEPLFRALVDQARRPRIHGDRRDQIRCFSCHALVPDIDGPTHPYMASSPGCWHVYGEILARQFSDPRLRDVRRYAADAYAVQHPGDPKRSPLATQSVCGHLMSLCLVLEQHAPHSYADQVLKAAVDGRIPLQWLTPPPSPGKLTVADVRAAISADEHREKVHAWARGAWAAWAEHHGTIRTWIARI